MSIGGKQLAATEQWLDWNQCRLSPAVIDIVLNTVFLGERGDQSAIARGRDKLRELEPILDQGLAGRSFAQLVRADARNRGLPALVA